VFSPVTNHKLGRSIQCSDLYDLFLVRTLYATTMFMICCWSERCMVWPSLWFVTGQNTVCYDQVYDLFLIRTLYGVLTCNKSSTWSQHTVFWPVTNHKLGHTIQCSDLQQIINLVATYSVLTRPSLWFVAGQYTVCYDQVYDLLLVRTLYVTTKFMICYWSKHCMLRPRLWFVTG
jgi:hypothetical protein